MEIILIQDVNKLGQKDDIVNVKAGYGRNYLIPRGYAIAASSSAKIFGSVNTIQIAESLKEKGFDIDRKNIILPEDQIKEVGNYKAVIKLHRDVRVEIEFEIKGE